MDELDACSVREIRGIEGKIIKIKANFDRTAVFMEDGRAYIWGGEPDLKHIGGDPEF